MKCEICGIKTTEVHDFEGKKLCEDCFFKKGALTEDPHKCGPTKI